MMAQTEKTCISCKWCLPMGRQSELPTARPSLPALCRSPKVGINPVTGMLRVSSCQDQRSNGPSAETDWRCAHGVWWEPKPVPETEVSPWLAGWLRRLGLLKKE